jgi:hypothetical protein
MEAANRAWVTQMAGDPVALPGGETLPDTLEPIAGPYLVAGRWSRSAVAGDSPGGT